MDKKASSDAGAKKDRVPELEAKVEELEDELSEAQLDDSPADVRTVIGAIRAASNARSQLSFAGEATFKRLLAKHAPQYQALMVPVRRAQAELARQQVVEKTAKGKRKLAAVENARVARALAKQAADNVRSADAAARAA